MTSRERTLAIVLVGGIVLCGGALLGYMFLYVPLQEKATQAETLDSEIADLDSKISSINRLRPQIAEVKRQSLPPDIDRAKLQYQQMLELLRPTGLPSPADFTVKFVRESVKKPPLTPVIAPNRPAYTQLEFNVDIENANIWQVVDFLYKFYQLDLLHRITELKIARANKPSDTRDRLKVNVTCEAIILDGVEPRSTLFPITNVVAAVGGFASIEAILQKNELLEKFTPHSTSPVLATRNRDYSLIARYDPFYGLLPDLPPEPPFSIAKVPDVVINQTDEAPQPVRVKLVGKGSTGASLKAEVKDGTLVPKGSIAVDPKTMTIALPKVSAELGSSASSTIAVVATSAEGETKETSFKVLMGKSPPAKLGPDISAAIKFIMITGSSEGNIQAVIFDAANPFKYLITVQQRSVNVVKYYQKTTKLWGPEPYEHPPAVLAFSDDFSETKHTFKIIAIEDEAVIVVDLAPKSPAAAGAPKMGMGMKMGPPGGGRITKQGHAEPIAAIAGNIAAEVPQPTYYRWPIGKSLKEVLDPSSKNPNRLSKDEVKVILKRVAQMGPLASNVPPEGGN